MRLQTSLQQQSSESALLYPSAEAAARLETHFRPQAMLTDPLGAGV